MYTLYIWIWNLKRQHICLYCILLQRAEEIQSVCGDSSASWVWGRHRWRWWKCYQSHSALHLQVKDFSYLLSNFPLHTSSKTTTEKNKNRFFHYADVADIDIAAITPAIISVKSFSQFRFCIIYFHPWFSLHQLCPTWPIYTYQYFWLFFIILLMYKIKCILICKCSNLLRCGYVSTSWQSLKMFAKEYCASIFMMYYNIIWWNVMYLISQNLVQRRTLHPFKTEGR